MRIDRTRSESRDYHPDDDDTESPHEHKFSIKKVKKRTSHHQEDESPLQSPFDIRKPPKGKKAIEDKDEDPDFMIPLEVLFFQDYLTKASKKSSKDNLKQTLCYSRPEYAIRDYAPHLAQISYIRDLPPSQADQFVFENTILQKSLYRIQADPQTPFYELEVFKLERGFTCVGTFGDITLSQDGWPILSSSQATSIHKELNSKPSLKSWLLWQNFLYLYLKIKFPLPFLMKTYLELKNSLSFFLKKEDFAFMLKEDFQKPLDLHKQLIDYFEPDSLLKYPMILEGTNLLTQKKELYLSILLRKQERDYEGVMLSLEYSKVDPTPIISQKYYLKQGKQGYTFTFHNRKDALSIRMLSSYLINPWRMDSIKKPFLNRQTPKYYLLKFKDLKIPKTNP